MSISMHYETLQGEVADAGGHEAWLDIDDICVDGAKRRITLRSGTRHDRVSGFEIYKTLVPDGIGR